MDVVLAKVKRVRKKSVFKLVSDCTLFAAVDVDPSACVPYNPDHNLDEESWFKISQFSSQPYCVDILREGFDSKSYDDLTKDKFTDISYVCAVQGEDFYFQKVTPSLFLRRKTLVFGEVAEVEKDRVRLVVNLQPDAVYIKAKDVLIFKSLATISSIFPGIDELYKEATQEELERFLAEPFIELANEFGAEKVSKPNRKRVALAMETLAALPAQDKEAMLAYIDGYCGDQLRFDKGAGKFEISSDNELKLLIYGIEQRFYTTQFGQEKRLANSVQALG
ncbi:ATP F0F1 synthase synthase [Pseudomonas sp. MAP12]|uniref:ATP F0F1 synthase synthase n=1 Tax=Geopseudomonas aromaticivorans TaxID=2849492 RepID=A0ABS6MUX8_9GAMM|nr:ATP F0F1 synthase synthase [Pseudomonas aromaticivorans]MBV2132605.1 ATP F0F1 synthase synthase [Pseudomonas aromaticivorans]